MKSSERTSTYINTTLEGLQKATNKQSRRLAAHILIHHKLVHEIQITPPSMRCGLMY